MVKHPFDAAGGWAPGCFVDTYSLIDFRTVKPGALLSANDKVLAAKLSTELLERLMVKRNGKNLLG